MQQLSSDFQKQQPAQAAETPTARIKRFRGRCAQRNGYRPHVVMCYNRYCGYGMWQKPSVSIVLTDTAATEMQLR